MSEHIWYKTPEVLFSQASWSKFVPTANMNTAAALNSVVRFATYFSVLLFITTYNSHYLWAIPLVAIATIVLNVLFPNGKRLEAFSLKKFTGSGKTQPTAANPFMNVLPTEVGDNPNRPGADNVTRKDVKAKLFSEFQKTADMYMDTSDLFDQNMAMMNFHTLQSSTIPNDQDKFLEFLKKGHDTPNQSSAFDARNAKILSESYVKHKGSEVRSKLTPPTTSKPSGSVPSSTPALSAK